MNQLTVGRHRINSIDLLRGIVMVVMALDHVRDFFHYDAFQHNPVNPQTTTVALFFTRWVTHFCAPVFLFLAGISAYLMGLKKTKKQLSIFLIKRGCWLVFIEVVIMTFVITFNPFYNTIILQVIWATGISMIILGLLVRLPYSVILIAGCCILFGHNLLDYAETANHQKVGFWWNFIHHADFTNYFYTKGYAVAIVYAFLPWTGIMLTGYCMGKLYGPSVDLLRRKTILLAIGSGLIFLFFVLRWLNGYGDPVHWSVQRNGIYTFLSFLNVNKYPPSLMYVAIMLGPALIFLALVEPIQNKLTAVFIVYGRVPFFYYILHFFLIHFLSAIAFFLSGYGIKNIVTAHFLIYFRPLGFGFNLWVVYLVWIFVVAVMYPLCKRYNSYKNTHRQWWLSYL